MTKFKRKNESWCIKSGLLVDKNRLLGNLQYLLLSFFCIDEIVTGKFFDYRGQFS